MCSTYKMNAFFYLLKSHPAIERLVDRPPLIVCHQCAMREEFGGNYKQSRRYKEYIDGK